MIFETPRLLKENSGGFVERRILDEMFTNRQIICLGEINAERANSLIIQLLHLEAEDPKGEIEMIISSPGGEVQAGLSVVDVMQAIGCPIKTTCSGTSASMAAVLFASGDKREMYEHSKLMLHNPLLAGVSGDALKIKDVADDIMETRNILAEIIAKASGHTLEEVFEKTAKDTYFTAQEAVEWGLADNVITPIFEENISF